jgi:hypothetical protein
VKTPPTYSHRLRKLPKLRYVWYSCFLKSKKKNEFGSVFKFTGTSRAGGDDLSVSWAVSAQAGGWGQHRGLGPDRLQNPLPLLAAAANLVVGSLGELGRAYSSNCYWPPLSARGHSACIAAADIAGNVGRARRLCSYKNWVDKNTAKVKAGMTHTRNNTTAPTTPE